MDNDNEFSYTSSNDFKQIEKNRKSCGFGSSFLLPFISGMLGASLIFGIVIGIPEVKNKFLNELSINQEKTVAESTQNSNNSNNSEYNATLMDIA